MTDNGDRWTAGDAYEAYMGRWSRAIARPFVEWLGVAAGGHWLEIGCGTGALTSTICALGEPAAVVACDQSSPFVAHARAHLSDARVSFVGSAADQLPERAAGFDAIVSGLVLNFVARPAELLAAMRARTRPGGSVAAYVWDYAGGMELLHHFWREAAALDPAAAALDESRRFGAWQPGHLASLFESAGLARIQGTALVVPTAFATFDDFWAPFLGGTGPAPSYVASLPPPQRDALAERLRARLVTVSDASIRLHARAFAVRGTRPLGGLGTPA